MDQQLGCNINKSTEVKQNKIKAQNKAQNMLREGCPRVLGGVDKNSVSMPRSGTVRVLPCEKCLLQKKKNKLKLSPKHGICKPIFLMIFKFCCYCCLFFVFVCFFGCNMQWLEARSQFIDQELNPGCSDESSKPYSLDHQRIP